MKRLMALLLAALLTVPTLGGSQVLLLKSAVVVAPTFVQSAYGTNSEYCTAGNSAATAIATFGSNVTSGSAIVVAFQVGNNWCATAEGVTVTDTLTNTYTEAISLYDGDNAQCIGIWYALNSGAGANTVTVTFPGVIAWRHIAVHEYSGVATASALDDADAQEVGAFAAWSSPDLTTTQQNDLIFGAALIDSGSQVAATAGSGFTQRVDCGEVACNATTCGWFTEDKIEAASGTVAASGTWASAPTNSIVAAIALKGQ